MKEITTDSEAIEAIKNSTLVGVLFPQTHSEPVILIKVKGGYAGFDKSDTDFKLRSHWLGKSKKAYVKIAMNEQEGTKVFIFSNLGELFSWLNL